MPIRQIFERLILKYALRHEARYARRWIVRMKLGRRHSTLGNDLKDEARTRYSAEEWLKYLRTLGLQPRHRCIEVGCGSLWAAEPIIRYLEPGRYAGIDITDYFYGFGRERLAPLLDEKKVDLAVIKEETLARLASRPADFVFARKVLAHVRPDELPGFIANFCRLLGPETIGVIDNPPTEETCYRNPGSIDYALADVARHLSPEFTATQDDWAIIVRRGVH